MPRVLLTLYVFISALITGCEKEASSHGSTDINGNNGRAHNMVFRGIAEPLSDTDKRQWHSSKIVKINDEDYNIDFHKLIATGQTVGTETFGLIKDKDGDPIKIGDGNICRSGSGPDYTSLLKYENKLFAVSQLECAVGGAYVMALDQDKSGLLRVTSLRTVDFSNVFGTYTGCAGVTTAWNTHLGSEEYEPPMGLMQADGVFSPAHKIHNKKIQAIAQYNKIPLTEKTAQHIGYYRGWIPEISMSSARGDTAVEKHYAMGRFSHELAYVMPDDKTVYLSDDGTRTGLFMFIADRPKDLSAGILYAAKWIQESNEGAGSASMEWINLGHATNAEIEAKLKDPDYTFSKMWIKAKPLTEGHCPSEFRSVNAGEEGHMCLKLINSAAKYASRLETRLYAAYHGATTEFNKEEGISFNSDSNTLYVAMSHIGKAMMDDHKTDDVGGQNDIRLPKNKCGAVYALDVVSNKKDWEHQAIESDYVATNMYGELHGQPTDYLNTPYKKNECNVNSIAAPDNVSYLPKFGILLIGEDTNSNEIDRIWAYDVRSKKLTRIFTTPYGAEATSPYWHKNVNGFGYITAVIQHPFSEITDTSIKLPIDSMKRESVVGYIGPFPRLDH